MAQLTIKQSIKKYCQQPVIKEDNTNTINTNNHGQRLIEKINC